MGDKDARDDGSEFVFFINRHQNYSNDKAQPLFCQRAGSNTVIACSKESMLLGKLFKKGFRERFLAHTHRHKYSFR